MPGNQEKPLNKHELSYLLFTVFRSLLWGLTGIHPEKVLHNIFGMPLKTLPSEKLPWTEIETKRLRFLLELIKAVKGPYDYSRFPGRVNDLANAGVRQWFREFHSDLENKKPVEFFHKTDWNPDDLKMQKLLEFAKKDGNPFYDKVP